jgi:undecaprenyl-diphosphatase
VVGAAVVVTIAVLLWRRRPIEAGALALGTLLTWAAVNIAKAAEGRPRPARPLVDTAGESYPSGHAAYAVAWVAIAVVLTRTLPGLARTTAAIIAAVVVAVLVALTRVTLRAHYLSDVVGGAGLAAALFALCGMGGLIVAHLRNNGARA